MPTRRGDLLDDLLLGGLLLAVAAAMTALVLFAMILAA